MVTGIFLVGYAIIIIVLGATECLHWVYTGIGKQLNENSTKQIISTNTIPLYIHRHVHISNGRNT